MRAIKTDSVYSITPSPFVYTAGWETLSASTEEAIFDNIGQVRDGNPAGTPNDLMSAHMNGAYADRRVAASLLLHGMSGDKFSVEAVGYYEDTSSANINTYAQPSAMLSAITGALTSNIAVGGEGSAAITQTINNLLSGQNYAAYEALKNSVSDPQYPRSYLNVLVFDEEFHLIQGQSQVVQLRGAATTWNSLSANEITLNGNGYVVSYLSHESNIDMYFDAVTTRHYVGTLQEEQHYYPHGVAIESGTSTLSLKKYLFQGNKLDEELGLNISDFNARMYDQQIGRFMSIDPLARNNQEMLSPYQFCGNNPANFIDPLGLVHFTIGEDGMACLDNVPVMADRLDLKMEVDAHGNGSGFAPMSFTDFSNIGFSNTGGGGASGAAASAAYYARESGLYRF